MESLVNREINRCPCKNSTEKRFIVKRSAHIPILFKCKMHQTCQEKCNPSTAILETFQLKEKSRMNFKENKIKPDGLI